MRLNENHLILQEFMCRNREAGIWVAMLSGSSDGALKMDWNTGMQPILGLHSGEKVDFSNFYEELTCFLLNPRWQHFIYPQIIQRHETINHKFYPTSYYKNSRFWRLTLIYINFNSAKIIDKKKFHLSHVCISVLRTKPSFAPRKSRVSL